MSNFSFVDEFIAGSAKPEDNTHLTYLKKRGIDTVISLTPEFPLVFKYAVDSKLTHVHIPVYSTPDRGQIKEFIDVMKGILATETKAVVHCQFGQERTGIFLVIYLVELQGFDLEMAIKYVTKSRPTSLRSYTSLQFLQNFC